MMEYLTQLQLFIKTDDEPSRLRFWEIIKDGNRTAYRLYRKHYSSRKNQRPKVRLFVGPGEKRVLLGKERNALFAWRKFIDDSGQQGVNCAVFRN